MLLPLINCWPLYMYCLTWNNSISSFFQDFSLIFRSSPCTLVFSSLPAIVDFLHPFSHPVSAGPVSPSPLCVMWWHLFTTQAAGCLLLSSVIWLLPFSEWGHSLGQQSTDRICRNARDSSVYFNTHRDHVWPSIFFSLVLSFSSHMCVEYIHIMDLSLTAIAGIGIETYVVIVTSLLETSLVSFISTWPLFWLRVKSLNL